MSEDTGAKVVDLQGQRVVPQPSQPTDHDHDLLVRALGEMRRRLDLLQMLTHFFGVRLYQWATLLLVAGAFAFVLAAPRIDRIIAAVLFAALVHIPTWFRRKDRHEQG